MEYAIAYILVFAIGFVVGYIWRGDRNQLDEFERGSGCKIAEPPEGSFRPIITPAPPPSPRLNPIIGDRYWNGEKWERVGRASGINVKPEGKRPSPPPAPPKPYRANL